jgi:hypothetical protein
MTIWRETTKVFAFLFLFFANFSLINAQDSIYRLDAGTKISVRMDIEINSEVSGADDTFTTTIAEPVRIRETVVLPAGTIIEGRVVTAKRAASAGRGGNLSLRFETIRLAGGEKREIEGVLVNPLEAASMQKQSLLTILGGTAVGAILGAVSKSGNGTLIGAGIGAGVGTGVVAARKGRDVRIKKNEKFDIELLKQVTLPVQDY